MHQLCLLLVSTLNQIHALHSVLSSNLEYSYRRGKTRDDLSCVLLFLHCPVKGKGWSSTRLYCVTAGRSKTWMGCLAEISVSQDWLNRIIDSFWQVTPLHSMPLNGLLLNSLFMKRGSYTENNTLPPGKRSPYYQRPFHIPNPYVEQRI